MNEDAPRKTQASLVYEQVRSDILAGRLKPNEPLRVEKLRARYKTSGSPVREALSKLSANGIVSSHDNRGFYVPSITRAELKEVYKTRCWIEEIALRESIANGDVTWEEGIVLAHHRMTRIPRKAGDVKASNPEWEGAHRNFHLALINACESRFLMRFCHQLHDQSDRYRQAAVAIAPGRDSEKEHQALVDAAIDRDADKAAALLHEHYALTQHIIMEGEFE